MALTSGGFQRKSKAMAKIPDSSLADIAFLLLIFFMVTTVFREERALPIDWPDAEATEQYEERQDSLLYVWLMSDGEVFINDQNVPMENVSEVVGPAWQASDEQLLISLRADAQVPYRYVDALQMELRSAGAVFVVFATELERRLVTLTP